MDGEHTGDEAELRRYFAQIAGLGSGTRSLWAARTAADAAVTEGVGGLLVVSIQPKVNDFIEVSFTSGIVEAVIRWK